MSTENKKPETPHEQPAPQEREAVIATEIASLQRQSIFTRRANAEPLPGPLLEAFGFLPVDLNGLTIRQAVAADFLILRMLGSPIITHLLNLAEHEQKIRSSLLPPDAPHPRTDLESEEVFEAIYLFTHEARRAYRELQQGRSQYRERAGNFLATRVAAEQLPGLIAAVQTIVLSAFATALEYGPAETSDGSTTINFSCVTGGARDGLGWWLDYVGRSASAFGWPLDYVLFDLPMARGFALNSWAIENDGLLQTSRVTPGYLRQEIQRLERLAAQAAPAP